MSIKKSSLLVIAVIVAVTLFSVVSTGGNSMQIVMSEEAITFSGIGELSMELKYADITDVQLLYSPDYTTMEGSYQSGNYRCGFAENETWGKYHLFITTHADCVIILEQSDGGTTIFNYNNHSDTEAIYNMLLENLKQ